MAFLTDGTPPTITVVSTASRESEVLVVVPTLGVRPTLLRQTLESIRAQSVRTDVVIVAPTDQPDTESLARSFDARIVTDPGGLPAAINLGVEIGLDDHEYVTWLNDDDLLEPNSLARTLAALETSPAAVVAFGWCRYIDDTGRELWISRAGSWAPRILGWGPDLIPQPGMVVRSSAWVRAGGLDTSYRLAFDLDLLLRLRTQGPFVHVNSVVSSFRWHPTSLTVEDRDLNIRESERAKRAALGPIARKFSWVWEGPVRVATHSAARQVNRRALRVRAS